MKECTYPPKTKQGHVKEPTAEYEVDTRADEDDIAPFLRVPNEELRRQVYESYEGWLRGERTYTTDEIKKMRPEWT